MKPDRIYLDSQNGCPIRPSVLKAMEEAALVGNPSSPHAEGRSARRLLEEARAKVAALIGARSEEITFTSSGTEANAWVLAGLSRVRESKGKHLVVSSVEHLSILQTTRRMEKEGWKATLLPVDRYGQVQLQELEKALTTETSLVSIQWANGEVGTLQPIAELVRRVKAKGILFHSDGVAAAGQVPINMREIPADALSLAANTFGGPSGVGALFVRKGVRIFPFFVGGAQEDGRRAGTENLIGAVGMGKAAEEARKEEPILAQTVSSLRDRLLQGILKEIPEARLNGHPSQRLPGHVSIGIEGADAETLVLALDMEGVAVGIGSACTSRTMKASHVLKAMGVDESHALGTITLTLCGTTSQEHLNQVVAALKKAASQKAFTGVSS